MSLDNLTIGIDINGGDFLENKHPSKRVFEAIKLAQEIDSKLKFKLYGDHTQLDQELLESSGVSTIFAPSYFTSIRTIKNDPETLAKDSNETSLFKLIDGVNSGDVDVAVSMHETSSMIVYTAKKIGMIPGLDSKFPLLTTTFPTKQNKQVLLADIGATSDTTPKELAEFGILATAYLENVLGVNSPKIKILSNGSEPYKGNLFAKETKNFLEAYANEGKLNFDASHPYIEGHIGLFDGDCDIVLTDGHTGNVLIKTIKGMKDLISSEFKEFSKSRSLKDMGILASLGITKLLYKGSGLENMTTKLNPATYNGAPLLGLNNYFVKLQSNSSVEEIVNGIAKAKDYANSNVVEVFRTNFS
jgi:phosphate acyltransferase